MANLKELKGSLFVWVFSLSLLDFATLQCSAMFSLRLSFYFITFYRALKKGLIEQETIDDYDPALMFTIPRLAIVW